MPLGGIFFHDAGALLVGLNRFFGLAAFSVGINKIIPRFCMFRIDANGLLIGLNYFVWLA